MIDNIYFFSQPVQSGKTTALMNFVHRQPACFGILAPDVDGFRKIFLIEPKSFLEFQSDEATHDSISIGRFHFLRNTFDICHNLFKYIPPKTEWTLIDEVGILEIQQNSGLEPALSLLIEQFKRREMPGKLVLVVRDSLLEQCKIKYGLENVSILDSAFFQNPIYHNTLPLKNTLGVIMCGGSSSRMGMDKGDICYFDKPQKEHLYKSLLEFFSDVVFSVNARQYYNAASKQALVADIFANCGPMAGVLSVHQKIPDKDLFIMGCDYPFIQKKHLTYFLKFVKGNEPVCFYNPLSQKREPLLAYYPVTCLNNLLAYYHDGHHSLHRFLEMNKAVNIVPWNAGDLQNVNTQEEFNHAMQKLKATIH